MQIPNKKIVILGGGSLTYVRNHLALCAPAYGSSARKIAELCREMIPTMDVDLQLTKMAGGATLETNDDIETFLKTATNDPNTKIIFMNAAICDFQGTINKQISGKYEERLKTVEGTQTMELSPTSKLSSAIRKDRKDIFLVAFKTTCGATLDEQYLAGLKLLKTNSCNLVLANDTKSRFNMIITPEEARYHVTENRDEVLRDLVDMTKLRSHLTFTRSTIVAGNPVPWNSNLIYPTLRTIVNHCIKNGAYKPFLGKTAGHFAVKLDRNTFLTSMRKTNFNDLDKLGLVKIVTSGPDSVLAYGARPSVGGQSQRIVFHDHVDYDCIVHFHSPIKHNSLVPRVSQREFECGSHDCGKNTSDGLKRFGNLSAVYLDNHGPNIVFHHSVDPQEVIDFIEANFDLSQKTGGLV